MQCSNLKMKSRSSSSSSGSLKLIHDHDLQGLFSKYSPPKDLFDQLLEDNYRSQQWAEKEFVRQTIQRMNLSPRSHPGCKCTKIDCLKMYCECFSKGRLCNQNCECACCCNKQGCEHQIFKAQQMANFRHPGTFKGIPAFVPLKKCTCKKSSCRKNYCECYRAGLKCSQECQCLDCQNGKPHINCDFFDSRMEIEVNA